LRRLSYYFPSFIAQRSNFIVARHEAILFDVFRSLGDAWLNWQINTAPLLAKLHRRQLLAFDAEQFPHGWVHLAVSSLPFLPRAAGGM
jgi:hypothetical protein